ncbi:hypothetical protein [Clostridium diolis]|nr:hypothetical protein [Clostridium diolis]
MFITVKKEQFNVFLLMLKKNSMRYIPMRLNHEEDGKGMLTTA